MGNGEAQIALPGVNLSLDGLSSVSVSKVQINFGSAVL